MQRESENKQHNPEHRQAKGRQTTHLSRPTRWPITPEPVLLFSQHMQLLLYELLLFGKSTMQQLLYELFAAGGKPSTTLPPGELAEQQATN